MIHACGELLDGFLFLFFFLFFFKNFIAMASQWQSGVLFPTVCCPVSANDYNYNMAIYMWQMRYEFGCPPTMR